MIFGVGTLRTGGTVEIDVPPLPFQVHVLDMESDLHWRSDAIDPVRAEDGLEPALQPSTDPLW